MHCQMPLGFLTALVLFVPLQDPPDQPVPLRERSSLRCPVEDLPAVSLPIPQGEVSLAESRAVKLDLPRVSWEPELSRLLREGPTAKRLGELARQQGAEAVVDVQVGSTQLIAVPAQQIRIQYTIRGTPVRRRSQECKPL